MWQRWNVTEVTTSSLRSRVGARLRVAFQEGTIVQVGYGKARWGQA